MIGFRYSSISMYYQGIRNLLGGSTVSHLHLSLPHPQTFSVPQFPSVQLSLLALPTSRSTSFPSPSATTYICSPSIISISPQLAEGLVDQRLCHILFVLALGVSRLPGRQTDVGCRYSTQWPNNGIQGRRKSYP
jgi:hypothetical protein